ncbi:hypothetical protein DSO57_1037136 [Entomophthora muscae]|uniref:Uncharacterized protein n=2 Tax=Entomophthora muscae TaxID=34485 RepID=A0ACC2RT40_9FUNG|nr:hypothetical protein DSO57_1026009 [Entomophthora muscae]KAJ9075333.1 hypothetical protein DSO57_1037136 [Entomophthora muscae]
MAGKALSYLVKLGPIIWWAMPVPALTPPSPAGATRYSLYPDNRNNKNENTVTNILYGESPQATREWHGGMFHVRIGAKE